MALVLASGSPRRRELLREIAPEFEVVPSSAEEIVPEGFAPEQAAVYLASLKAEEVKKRRPADAVLAADTVVALNGKILGKPADRADAKNTLRLLSGKIHEVITGVRYIGQNSDRSFFVKTEVEFNELSGEIIDAYVASGLCMDKAGSYGIQDGFPLVKSYRGSYTNVVGLPLDEVLSVTEEDI